MCVSLLMLASLSRMMLQHSGPSLADISCSALVPCLTPSAPLTLEDLSSFTPLVKDELRLAIHNKRLSSGLDLSSDGSSSDRLCQHQEVELGCRREVSPHPHPPHPSGHTSTG